MKKLFLVLALGLASSAFAQSSPELFVTLNSGQPQTQGMALVLANQAAAQKVAVRVLLCSEGAQLAITSKESVRLKPPNVTPKDMLSALMKAGAKVEVCALFLPNSDWKESDLIAGVTVAKPADVATYMMQPHVKAMTF
ncbi:MAG: DsrE family protein [Burkholderiaceae bacterium]|nr:DsrE family protein [Burkholderiaceae bacterium]